MVDGGNLLFCKPELKPLELDQLLAKARAVIQAYNEIGVAGVAIGPYDLAAGYGRLRELMQLAEFPFLCANLLDRDTGRPVFQPYTVIEAGGFKVGLIGVMDPPEGAFWLSSQERAFRVDPIYKSVKQYTKELKDQSCDLIVVLSSADAKKFRLLTQNYPYVDIYITGDPQDAIQIPWKIGSSIVANSGHLGRYVGDIYVESNVPGSPPIIKHHFVAMKPELADDPFVKRTVDHYYNYVAMVRSSDPGKYVEEKEQEVNLKYGHAVYVSAPGCGKCHPKEYSKWEQTSHAKAYRSIPTDQRNRVECLECHVTGFGEQGGFFLGERGPDLTGIQCEACHGPGSLHPASPAVRSGQQVRQVCQQCHTKSRSPGFQLKAYLKRVACNRGEEG